MNCIIFDTETDARVDSDGKFTNNQNVIDLAWRVIKDGKLVKNRSFLIHGSTDKIYKHQTVYTLADLTKDKAKEWNVVFSEFLSDLKQLPDDGKVYAHNLKFDAKAVIYTCIQQCVIFYEFEKIIKDKGVCTMKTTTELCGLEYPWGFKWPKLNELAYKLLGKRIKQLHTASGDVEMLHACIKKLDERGFYKTK